MTALPMPIYEPVPLTARPDGLHANVPAEVYHQRELGLVSKSALEKLAKTPLHYHAWATGAVDDELTPPLAFGQGFHCALLEPGRFDATYAVEPFFGDCRKTENKTKRDEWRRKNDGKSILTAGDNAAIVGMMRAVRAHPLAGKMMQDGEAELTALWTDKETNLRCKVRTDYYVRKFGMAVDVKSAVDAGPRAFAKSVFNFGYHLQHALYRAGLAAVGEDVKHFVYIAVEKTPPYAVAIYELDDRGIRAGHMRARDLMNTMARCMVSGDWPGYPTSIQVLETPGWAE